MILFLFIQYVSRPQPIVDVWCPGRIQMFDIKAVLYVGASRGENCNQLYNSRPLTTKVVRGHTGNE
jgi:hypothetical protein